MCNKKNVLAKWSDQNSLKNFNSVDVWEYVFKNYIYIFFKKIRKKLHAMIELYTQLSIADKMTPAKWTLKINWARHIY